MRFIIDFHAEKARDCNFAAYFNYFYESFYTNYSRVQGIFRYFGVKDSISNNPASVRHSSTYRYVFHSCHLLKIEATRDGDSTSSFSFTS